MSNLTKKWQVLAQTEALCYRDTVGWQNSIPMVVGDVSRSRSALEPQEKTEADSPETQALAVLVDPSPSYCWCLRTLSYLLFSVLVTSLIGLGPQGPVRRNVLPLVM